MNQIQKNDVTLSVSAFNDKGFWMGNREEFVSAGTALGSEYTTVFYTPTDETKIGKFDQTTQTWEELTNNVLTEFWDASGQAYRVNQPDSPFPEWAIFDAPPEHDSKTQYVSHNGQVWEVKTFDIEDDPTPQISDEPLEPIITPQPVELSDADKAQNYLSSTDWYVTRKLETGTAIPKEVMTNRDKCRALLVTELPSTDFLNQAES